ncbi:MAG: DUF547 domain-containing protein [Hyphomicrobiaceae bacterium]|nr:DUF547 domain-containing protein [Hyphomicrobiaceae bacterium]
MALAATLIGVCATAEVALAASPEVTAAFSAHKVGATVQVDHHAWDQLLKSYVKPAADGVNRVDYKSFKANGGAALKAYVADLERTKVSALDRPVQLAFWINLYNAKTVDIVLDHYPVASIRDISLEESLLGFLKKSVGAGGPWKTPIVNVEGRRLSLDNIEHDILRPVFKDPRVHYAVNCASYGCPNLQAAAFTGANADAMLTEGAKAYVNHPRGISVKDGRVKASSIYNWFQTDFGGSDAGVLQHVRLYATPELKAALAGVTAIDSYDYDWRLNDISR